jgi:four helix bundle protein
LTLDIYKITSGFPSEEKFGLVNQMRRTAYSIPANIVEGYSRKSRKEFLQFLNIAKSSLDELKYFLILSFDLGYINRETNSKMEEKLEEISKVSSDE